MIIRTKTKVYLASLLYAVVSRLRQFLGLKNAGIFKRRGTLWNLDLAEGVDFSIFLFGRYEWDTYEVYRKLIAPGSVVVDIGANIGGHCLQLAECVGENGHVYALEPTRFAYEKLKQNLALNPALDRRVTAVQAICVSGNGGEDVTKLYSSWPLSSEAVTHDRHCGVLMGVEGALEITLDAFIKESNIASVDLIKMDVDGNEDVVLKGARDTLMRMRPIMIMELAPYVLDERPDALE